MQAHCPAIFKYQQLEIALPPTSVKPVCLYFFTAFLTAHVQRVSYQTYLNSYVACAVYPHVRTCKLEKITLISYPLRTDWNNSIHVDLKDKTGDYKAMGYYWELFCCFFYFAIWPQLKLICHEVSCGLQVMLHACKWTDLIQSERYGSFDDQHLLITAGVHNSLQKTKGKTYFPWYFYW